MTRPILTPGEAGELNERLVALAVDALRGKRDGLAVMQSFLACGLTVGEAASIIFEAERRVSASLAVRFGNLQPRERLQDRGPAEPVFEAAGNRRALPKLRVIAGGRNG